VDEGTPRLLVEGRPGGREVAVVATVHRARDRVTDALKRRPDVRVVRVTEATRDALPEQLRDWLVGTPPGEE
jgi:nucleoside-triphosphatase THEP1